MIRHSEIFWTTLGLVALASCTGPGVAEPDTACAACDTDTTLCSAEGVVAGTSAEAPQEIQVSWHSDVPGTGVVEYGLDADLGSVSGATAPDTTEHHVHLRGLKAGHTYSYRAVSHCADGGVARSPLHSFSVDPTPQELGAPTLTLGPDQTGVDGLVLLSEFGIDGSWLVVLDRDGDTVWYRQADPDVVVLTSRPTLAGTGVAYAQQSIDQSTDHGATVALPYYGGEPVNTCNRRGHHDFAELPDGLMGFLSVELRWSDVDGELEYVAGDAILETPAGSTDCEDTERVFSFFDDYGHDPWPASPEFYGELAGGRDWTHANSLIYEPASDDYFLGARNLDAILRIDRATGEVLWQMGGEYGDFTFADDSDRWNHGHFSEIWDGGLLVFDNLGHDLPSVSRVAEYAWDEEERTVELVWEYVDDRGRVAAMGGDAMRLPSGNVLASWGSMGMVTEITRDGQVIWKAELPLGAAAGRVSWLEDLGSLQ